MKRKGRKSKVTDIAPNGVSEREDQNGEYSEREEQVDQEPEPEGKKRKAAKRKSVSKKSEEDAEETQYEAEEIIEEKFIKGVRHYLIRWKGYEADSDTWEPESTLDNCLELIKEFKAKQKKKGKAKSRVTKNKGKDLLDSDEKWDENENFEVERILDVYFKKNGQREFLVSWKGYPASQNSWEPEENMDCKDLIKRFMAKVERAKETEHRELRVNRTHTDRFTLLTDARGRRLSKRNLGRQRVHYHDAE